jgi:hypothetical protein
VGPPSEEPYELVVSGHKFGHDESAIVVYRSLDAWRDHCTSQYHHPLPAAPCPEPDLSGRMLIEVAAGKTSTGSARLEVTAVDRIHSGLKIQATLHYPTGNHGGSRDLGSPFVVLTTPALDGYVYLDLSVLHGIRRWTHTGTP